MQKRRVSTIISCIVLAIIINGCVGLKPQFEPTVTEGKETRLFDDVVKKSKVFNDVYGAENVLIVLDIDNTILTSSVDLGGDIWYQWQRAKLEIKPGENQVVPCLFEDSIGLLYELCPMNLTEASLPETILNWKNSGNIIMALTSRAPRYRAATERELINKGINFELAALTTKGEKDVPVFRKNRKGREWSYMKGIMMVSGMDKGEMLTLLLEKTGRKFDAIIFVDDSQKNVDAMYNTFSKTNGLDMAIFKYTHIEESRKEKYGTVLTQEQVIKMDADWKKLNQTLNEIFPARKLNKGECHTK